MSRADSKNIIVRCTILSSVEAFETVVFSRRRQLGGDKGISLDSNSGVTASDRLRHVAEQAGRTSRAVLVIGIASQRESLILSVLVGKE